MKFIFDHNISFVIPKALDAVLGDEHDFIALRDKFHPATADIEWIGRLSAEGHWVVVSGDRRITKNKSEAAAFRASRLTGFFMAPALYKAPVLKQLERLAALWINIAALAAAAQPGGMYELPIKGDKPRPLR